MNTNIDHSNGFVCLRKYQGSKRCFIWNLQKDLVIVSHSSVSQHQPSSPAWSSAGLSFDPFGQKKLKF
jgi:hypothetical protein